MKKGGAQLGIAGEDAAVRHLRRCGYTIVARNFKGGGCEVDVVARDGATLVFVEVKTRSGLGFGHPAEAVTARKRQQIERAALAWLATHGGGEPPVRFDVVAVLWEGDSPKIELIRNAFESR
ncbi:MAG: YraN family protein [Thermodesulfobacteriota bacterium]